MKNRPDIALSKQQQVISPDGSRIGYELRGSGPMLLAVHGATSDRERWEAVAAPLTERFTLVAMDRRGRGLSCEESTGPYSIEREAEDLRAVIAALAAQSGAPVYLLGHSYGGICALDAARGNTQVAKTLIYEPAFATPGADVIGPASLAQLQTLIDAGQLEAALELFFLRVIELDAASVAMMKQLPRWEARLATVHTLVREGCAANAWRPDHLREVPLPLRFLVGGISPVWLRAAAYAAQAAASGSDIVELPGQAHAAMDTAPGLFVAEVLRFWDDGKL